MLPVLELTHVAASKRWPSEPQRGETRRPRVANHTFAPAVSRMSSGSACARLPDGELRRRPSKERMINNWHTEREHLGKENLSPRGKQPV